jgi:hypothetical protein
VKKKRSYKRREVTREDFADGSAVVTLSDGSMMILEHAGSQPSVLTDKPGRYGSTKSKQNE